jgi:hypothetical protein
VLKFNKKLFLEQASQALFTPLTAMSTVIVKYLLGRLIIGPMVCFTFFIIRLALTYPCWSRIRTYVRRRVAVGFNQGVKAMGSAWGALIDQLPQLGLVEAPAAAKII